MLNRCEAAGAPRDLGRAQGVVYRRARREASPSSNPDANPGSNNWLRDAALFVLRFGGRHLRSPLHTRARLDLIRETRRHFPHFAERQEALARAAGLTAREGWDAVVASALCALAVRREDKALRVVLPASIAAGEGVFRDLRADGALRVQSLAPAMLAGAIAGQNEVGLTGAFVERAPLRPDTESFGAPAFLLLEQCLERCEVAERAALLASRRPGMGHGTLHFLDAKGDYRRVEVDGEKRECVPYDDQRHTVGVGIELRLIPEERRMVAVELDLDANLEAPREAPA